MSVHDLIVAPFSYEFMRRGVLSAAVLSLSGGLLGCILVLRRLALMGDALSHSLLPGIALAWLLFGPSTTALFVGALVAGPLAGLLGVRETLWLGTGLGLVGPVLLACSGAVRRAVFPSGLPTR